MIAIPQDRLQPSKKLSENVRRMQLAKLSHSDNDLAAATAVGIGLLLDRIDQLLEALEVAA